jgi:hypothetical protein
MPTLRSPGATYAGNHTSATACGSKTWRWECPGRTEVGPAPRPRLPVRSVNGVHCLLQLDFRQGTSRHLEQTAVDRSPGRPLRRSGQRRHAVLRRDRHVVVPDNGPCRRYRVEGGTSQRERSQPPVSRPEPSHQRPPCSSTEPPVRLAHSNGARTSGRAGTGSGRQTRAPAAERASV